MPQALCATAPTVELPASAPQWVQLLPLGTFKGRDGRGPWRVASVADAERIIAASLAYAGTVRPVIDYDHQSDLGAPKGGTAPAAGWIAELQPREDGVWGRVEWTERAAALIGAREYRYLSPVFDYDPKTGNVARIQRAALTNTPALNLTALASVGAPMSDFVKRLVALLSLPENSDEAAVVAAVEKLTKTATALTSAVPDPALYVPRAMYDEATTALASMRSNLTDEQATVKVDAAIRSGLLTPAQREWGLAICRQNPASFDEFTRTAPPVFANLAREMLPARSSGGEGGPGQLTENQRALCATMNLDPGDYAKNL